MAKKKSKNTKGKKQKLAIMIAIGKPKEMAYGGMASGKKHMYAASKGMVVENPGLKALKKASPEAYTKITGRSV